MARLALNKASLLHESSQLETFERFLPSLDLKRRQLMQERAKAARALAATGAEIESLRQVIGGELPMLADESITLDELVRIEGVGVVEENVMGTRLPVLVGVDVAVRDYGFLVRPHWVDALVERLRRMLELRIRRQVEQRRLELLEEAVRKITQRVNLFDKVLVPRTRSNIRRIRVFLADAERAGVVRAKLAKAKQVEGRAP